MEANDVPGLAFTMVEENGTTLSKGYGAADLARASPVVPAKTIFCFGSLSKILTTAAVLQLVEQEKLDLEANIGGVDTLPLRSASLF